MRNWRKRQQAHSGEGLTAAIYKKEVFDQKILDFEFSHGYHYSHARRHLGEDFRKFSDKKNDKNWSYQSKTFKNWIFGKNGNFLAKKNPQFWIFPRVPLLKHASRHLGEDFGRFSAKTNDKNWSY